MGKNVFSDEKDELEVDEEGEPIEGDTLNDRDRDDDDEEDQEGHDEYENDGFIVGVEDEVVDEDEEMEDSHEGRRKKKKKEERRRKPRTLMKMTMSYFGRMMLMYQSKNFKRLKKAQRDLYEDRFGFSDDEFDGSMKGGTTAEEKLKRIRLPFEDIPEDEEQIEEEEDGDIGEEDEMADFIVDKEYEHGASVRRKKKYKSRQTPGTSQYALKEAHDIFGDVDELLLLRKRALDSSELKERRLEYHFESTVLSEKYMTEKDVQIRMTDIPERMQISEESTGTPPTDEMSIIEESTWIHNQLISGAILLFGKERQDLLLHAQIYCWRKKIQNA